MSGRRVEKQPQQVVGGLRLVNGNGLTSTLVALQPVSVVPPWLLLLEKVVHGTGGEGGGVIHRRLGDRESRCDSDSESRNRRQWV